MSSEFPPVAGVGDAKAGPAALIDSVVLAWKALGLTEKKPLLDQSALEMTERHEACLTSRKELTVATKDFRKLPDEEKLAHLTALLKKYQEEVDSQTRRARTAEKSFVSLYRELYVAPDPVPGLLAAASEVRRSAALEERVAQLVQEVSSLDEELGKLNNQDITMRDLESRLLSMESDIKQQVDQRLKAKELELSAQLEAEVCALRLREKATDARVVQADEAVLAAQKMSDELQHDLFELRNRFDEALAAHQCELDILSTEVERLQPAAAGTGTGTPTGTASWKTPKPAVAPVKDDGDQARLVRSLEGRALEAESEVQRQIGRVAALTAELAACELTAGTHTRMHAEAVASLSAELCAKSLELAQAQRELASRPSAGEASELRQQLAALQALLFNAEAEGDGRTPQPSNAGGEAGHALQGAALVRVRQLEASLTRAHRDLQAKSLEAEDCKRKHLDATETLRDQQLLIERLESEMEAGTRSSGFTSRVSVPVAQPTSFSHDSQLLAILPTSTLASSEFGQGAASSGAGVDSSSTSLVTIVQGQRDRFRHRMLELESQKDQLSREVEEGRARVDKLLEDNVKLYEKIRYLESYSRAPASGVSTNQVSEVAIDVGAYTGQAVAHVPGLGPKASGVGRAADVESSYKRLYEDKVNPFTDFSRREKAQRYGNLSAAEKITLNSTRMLLANKFARTFVFFYAVALHGLVFATLFHFTNVAHH